VKPKSAQSDYPAASHLRNASVLIGEIAVSKGDATHFLTTGSDARQTPVAAKESGAVRISAPLSLNQPGETLSHKFVYVVI
jgi:hypothetical protein